ncbi:MAG: hypothetical protein ACKVX9_11925, partial [Blastocatellia bacterium]
LSSLCRIHHTLSEKDQASNEITSGARPSTRHKLDGLCHPAFHCFRASPGKSPPLERRLQKGIQDAAISPWILRRTGVENVELSSFQTSRLDFGFRASVRDDPRGLEARNHPR